MHLANFFSHKKESEKEKKKNFNEKQSIENRIPMKEAFEEVSFCRTERNHRNDDEKNFYDKVDFYDKIVRE